MKNQPKARTLTLEHAMRFSVGAGTKVSSCNVSLEDITSHDLEKGQTKRDFAAALSAKLAYDNFVSEFGKIETELMQTIVTHTEDSVTSELWVRGPDRIKIDLIKDAGKK